MYVQQQVDFWKNNLKTQQREIESIQSPLQGTLLAINKQLRLDKADATAKSQHALTDELAALREKLTAQAAVQVSSEQQLLEAGIVDGHEVA